MSSAPGSLQRVFVLLIRKRENAGNLSQMNDWEHMNPACEGGKSHVCTSVRLDEPRRALTETSGSCRGTKAPTLAACAWTRMGLLSAGRWSK